MTSMYIAFSMHNAVSHEQIKRKKNESEKIRMLYDLSLPVFCNVI